MDEAQKIRAAVKQVEQLGLAGSRTAGLEVAITAVKAIQSRRFAGTYSDLLAGGTHAAAARFFLDELYSDKDYAERDAQFSRIAGTVQRFFPRQVVATAVALAQLHLLTESLDYAMGEAWLSVTDPSATESLRYIASWRSVSRRAERETQLSAVMKIGQEMSRLTRTPGLSTMLKMMRAPAAAAGLSSLQQFLESGFATFASMARRRNGAEEFLQTIKMREAALISSLFDAELSSCDAQLRATLGINA
jgi:hypothetical protein